MTEMITCSRPESFKGVPVSGELSPPLGRKQAQNMVAGLAIQGSQQGCARVRCLLCRGRLAAKPLAWGRLKSRGEGARGRACGWRVLGGLAGASG